MTHREGALTGAGALSIFWQAWLPDSAPQAVVVLAHGAGEHSGRYRYLAARLVADGYSAYAIDHRGHGRSSGPRALIDRIGNAVSDLQQLIALAAAESPGAPVFLLGHSMGGAIAISYALAHQDRLHGLVLSAPLAALEAAPPPIRLAARVLSALAPRLPLFPVDASLISRDPDVVDEYQRDPLVCHTKLPVRTVAELAGAIESFPQRVAAITVPALIMYGTSDQLCPPQGSLMLSERIGSEDKVLKAYDGLYHEIFNEPDRDRVLDDLCSWLAAHVPAGLAVP